MQLTRSLIAVALGAALFTTGCSRRNDDVLLSELRNENARLTAELNGLQETARDLETERNFVQAENVRLRGQLESVSTQIERQNINPGLSLGKGVSINDETGGLSLDQAAFFKSGSAMVTSEGQATLAKLASLLNGAEYRDTIVVVEGHTDNTPVKRRPTVEKFVNNWGLSAMRAAAVITVLKSKGIAVGRLRGAFAGEYDPKVANTSRDNKAKNRRVEIYLTLPTAQ
jgi:chemotaxis protein MotB